MQPQKKQSLQWGYHDFIFLNDLLFPSKMNITLSTASRKIEAELLFSDIAINEPIQLTMNVPVGYTRTSIDEILKIFPSITNETAFYRFPFLAVFFNRFLKTHRLNVCKNNSKHCRKR